MSIYKLCQYRQHRSSNTHRTELIENCLMVDPIKGYTEINLQHTYLLSTLQCTFQCMGHTKKCITGTQILPLSKLGGWKDITEFHKSSETNRHHTDAHTPQTIPMLWESVGNWQQRGLWTFRNSGDIGFSLASRKLPRRTSCRNTTPRWGPNISSSKRGNIPNGSVSP